MSTPNTPSPLISNSTWVKFLDLVEPEGNYDRFFVLLTQRIGKLLWPFKQDCYVSAEDVASETVFRLLQTMERGLQIEKKSFKGLTIRIARNYLTDVRRHCRREISGIGISQPYIITDGKRTYIPISESNSERPGYYITLVDEISRDLPQEDSELFRCWIVAGMSGREIAHNLGVNEAAARKKISRLREKLKSKIGQAAQQRDRVNKERLQNLRTTNAAQTHPPTIGARTSSVCAEKQLLPRWQLH